MEQPKLTPAEQGKEVVTFLEKAIDVAVAKGCYNKMEVIQIVNGLQFLYLHFDKLPNDNKVPFKGIKEK